MAFQKRSGVAGTEPGIVKRGELGEMQRQINEAVKRMGLAGRKFGSQSFKSKKGKATK